MFIRNRHRGLKALESHGCRQTSLRDDEKCRPQRQKDPTVLEPGVWNLDFSIRASARRLLQIKETFARTQLSALRARSRLRLVEIVLDDARQSRQQTIALTAERR